MIDVGNDTAVYTADEARQLATAIESASNKKWERNVEELVEYIRDIADVADNKEDIDWLGQKWDIEI
jgi:hypothetical protein